MGPNSSQAVPLHRTLHVCAITLNTHYPYTVQLHCRGTVCTHWQNNHDPQNKFLIWPKSKIFKKFLHETIELTFYKEYEFTQSK